MRIHFLNLGHANRCLKICKTLLASEVFWSCEEARLPTHRLQNALAQGFGYSSYQDLSDTLLARGTVVNQSSSGVPLEAMTKSFRLGIAFAKEMGIQLDGDSSAIPRRLAREALSQLQGHAPTAFNFHEQPAPKGIFYRLRIEGLSFKASLSCDGPYLSHASDGVALGVCSIVPRFSMPSSPWVVVKYGSEIRINLQRLSTSGVVELSERFGIPMYPHTLRGSEDHGEAFLQSDAYRALLAWTSKHPRMAARITDEYTPYMPSLGAEIECSRLLPFARDPGTHQECSFAKPLVR